MEIQERCWSCIRSLYRLRNDGDSVCGGGVEFFGSLVLILRRNRVWDTQLCVRELLENEDVVNMENFERKIFRMWIVPNI